MPEKWNRDMRRRMGRVGIAQETLEREYDKVRETTRRDAYRNAFAGMLLALHQDYGFGYLRLRRIAIHTLNNINSSLCASDMIDTIKKETGFDVDEPIPLEELENSNAPEFDGLDDGKQFSGLLEEE